MWLEVDEDLPEHPKSLRLCAALMNPLGWAYVIKLWRWCVKFAPSGDLTNFGAEELEYGLGWTLDAGKLYAALKNAGFIEDREDGRVFVHDWMEHQGRALKKMENDAKRKRNSRRSRPRDVQRTSNGRRPDVRVTAPVPNLTKPNLTKPEETESSAVPSEPAEPAILVFPCNGKQKTWNLTRTQVELWIPLYPGVPVELECRKALAWILAQGKKTAGGMEKFLVGWLNRHNDRNGARVANNPYRAPRVAGPPVAVAELFGARAAQLEAKADQARKLEADRFRQAKEQDAAIPGEAKESRG